MWHSLTSEGFGVRMRPVRMDDAAFIVWLRNLERAKGQVGDSATSVAGQEAWLKAYFNRAGDYYFIVETLGEIPLGTQGIYDISGTSAEQGRFIIRPEVPAALPCVMNCFDLAFGQLGLNELHGTVVSTNATVISFNRKLGFQQVKVERGGRIIGGKAVDMVHFILAAGDWPKARERLIPLAQLAERQVRGWEQAQAAMEPR